RFWAVPRPGLALLGARAVGLQRAIAAAGVLVEAVFEGDPAEPIAELPALRLRHKVLQARAECLGVVARFGDAQPLEAAQARRVERQGMPAQRALHDPTDGELGRVLELVLEDL